MTSPGELTHEPTAAPSITSAAAASGTTRERPDARPALRLIFFTSPTSGPCRRMHGLVAWVKVTRKAALSVAEADIERHAPLARRLGVSEAPTLVLMRDGTPVARRAGRLTGREIDQLLRPWLPTAAGAEPAEAGSSRSPDEASAADPDDRTARDRVG